MSKHADVTLTCGDEVSSLLSLLNVVMAAHGRPVANDSRLFCLKCVCWSVVKNRLLHRCLHFLHCWSAFHRLASCDVIVVICRMTAVTWFDALTN